MPGELHGELSVRSATAADLPAVTETISRAFHDDPTWSWAFDDPVRRQEQYRVWWAFLIEGALRYPWVLVSDRFEAAAVWIPPGGTELAEADEARVATLVETLVGPRTGEVMELLERFGEARPVEPHYYLSLLGTHPDHRGRGIGMRLLAENLERVDQERMSAYLESSNPGNNPRYGKLGFEAIGAFHLPGTALPVTRMWRDGR